MSTVVNEELPFSVLMRRPLQRFPPVDHLSTESDTASEADGSNQGGEDEQTQVVRDAREVVIVPSADVLLKVGKGSDALDIKVLGAIISTASLIFSAMLSSPMWQEGSSREIELYEEEPEAVLAFCNLIHFKWKGIDLRTSCQMVKLALFADMHLCTEAVEPWFEKELAYHRYQIEDYAQHLPHGYSGDVLGFGDPILVEEDVMAIAAIFGFHCLLWDEAKAYLWGS
jgi:hypothetical protein